MSRTKLTHAALAVIIAGCFNAQAEVKEIPPEEMTETYIRDTTVIVTRQKQTMDKQKAGSVNVKPIEAPYSEGESTDATLTDALPLSENYAAEIDNNNLTNTTAYQFESRSIDPSQSQREENLRQVIGLEAGAAIDYNNLAFPTDATATGGIPAGISSATTASQFEIVMPNNGGYTPQVQTTPNGEFQVEVTPDDITLRMNLPQQ